MAQPHIPQQYAPPTQPHVPQPQQYAPPTQPHVPQPQQQVPPGQPLFPVAAAEDVPWAKQSNAHKPLTGRNRQHLRSLPGWDPLPPGEILVQRHRRAD
jgi:hypothetical protein